MKVESHSLSSKRKLLVRRKPDFPRMEHAHHQFSAEEIDTLESLLLGDDSETMQDEANRRVSFGEAQQSPIPSPLQFFYDDEDNGDNDWRRELWYQVDELQASRMETGALCKLLRQQQQATNVNAAPQVLLAADGDTRGVEYRICPERNRRKFLSVKIVLAQQKELQHQDAENCCNGGTHDQIAALYQRCTDWAKVVAVEEAARDFYRAYDTPHDPSPKRKFRQHSADDPHQRSVRRRLLQPVGPRAC